MAETKFEKILAPVAVGVGVIGVWLALRRPAAQAASPPVATPSGPGLSIPALPPLQTTEYGPVAGNVGNTGAGTATGTGASTGANPAVVTAAAQNPLAPILAAPDAPLPVADYLSYNVPPWLSLGRLLSTMHPAGAVHRLEGFAPGSTFEHCGCEADGCGASACDQSVTPRQPDGHGSCLTAQAKVPEKQFQEQVGALQYFSTDPWNLIRPQGTTDSYRPALVEG